MFDEATGRLGYVMDRVGSRVQLRPDCGGVEWDARPEDVREAVAGDVLRVKVREHNVRMGMPR